jgi:hypothetical protein
LISSNDPGDYKRLLFWSHGFGFEIFGTPPTNVNVEEACATSIFNQLPGADEAQAQEEREENADSRGNS